MHSNHSCHHHALVSPSCTHHHALTSIMHSCHLSPQALEHQFRLLSELMNLRRLSLSGLVRSRPTYLALHLAVAHLAGLKVWEAVGGPGVLGQDCRKIIPTLTTNNSAPGVAAAAFGPRQCRSGKLSSMKSASSLHFMLVARSL